jgi:hypothetical protein
LSRSAASLVMITVSMPNCRKHSESTILAESWIPTRATRANAFLVRGGEKTVAVAFSMNLVKAACETLFWPVIDG